MKKSVWDNTKPAC